MSGEDSTEATQVVEGDGPERVVESEERYEDDEEVARVTD